MGINTQFIYCAPVDGTEKPGYSKEYRCSNYIESIVDENSEYKDWWLFGDHGDPVSSRVISRQRYKQPDGTLSDFVSHTLGETKEKAETLYVFLVENNLVSGREYDDEKKLGKIWSVGIYAKNSYEWFLTEMACTNFGITVVPLYDTYGKESLEHCVESVGLETIACSNECGMRLLEKFDTPTVKAIILLDYLSDELAKLCTEKNVKYFVQRDMLEVKKTRQDLLDSRGDDADELPNPTWKSVNTICFTSGTSGMPKGVILTNAMIYSTTYSVFTTHVEDYCINSLKDISILSYLPLAHIFQRIVDLTIYWCGGVVNYFCGDVTKFLDDVKLLNPLVAIAVPRVLHKIKEKVYEKLGSPILQGIFSFIMQRKINAMKDSLDCHHWFWDLFLGRFSTILGNRAIILLSGGAPLSETDQKWFQCLFQIPVTQGYGTTETCGATFLCSLEAPYFGSVGGPCKMSSLRLARVPDMSYDPCDPLVPCGELQIKSVCNTRGYFRNPEANKESFTEDGFYKTGDIVEIKTCNSIYIVDRCKNIFKLSQGEYIQPEKIECYISSIADIHQVLVDGDSTKDHLVALVVLEYGKYAHSSDKELNQDEELKKKLLKAIEVECLNKKLCKFEIPKRIHLTFSEFTIDNGLLTPSMKTRRTRVKQLWKHELMELYNN